METLRGVFPKPKTQPKRDFVKENIRRCRDKKSVINYGKCSSSNECLLVDDMASGSAVVRQITTQFDKKNQKQIKCNKKSTKQKTIESSQEEELHSNRSRDCSSQTYDIYDDDFLKNVIIRIPSASVLEKLTKKSSPQDDCEINLYGINNSAINSHHDENNKIDVKKQLTSTNSTNTTNVANTTTRSSKSIMPTNYKYGELPKYLVDMKEKNADQLRLTELEDKNCPDGHVALTEEERIQTLEIANRKFLELVDELNKMPLTVETLRIKKRKIEIEKELNKLEENIQIFSRKKVYVKIDN